MKIHVDRNVTIESDSMQFIVKKYSGKFDKKGKETYTVLGYHTTLESVFKNLLKMKLFESEETTLRGLLDEQKRIERELKQLISA